MKKGQAVNIDWTVALGLFLITSLTAVIFLTNVDTSPDRISTLEAKNIEIQENLINETSVEGKKIPLIVRGPHKISNIPIDRHYNFPSKAFTESGGGDIPAELDISNNSVVAITDSGNLTHSLAYFQENVSNASYTNDITTESDQINNSKISLRTGGSGINSLKINGQELLNPDADLGSGDSSITEHGIYAETLSGDLRAYNNSSELILDDRTENVTFNLESLDTLYWYENDTAISLTGTGVKAEGKTKGFTVASNHGITFVGDMDATISKPDESTVKAEIDAERIRIRLHDSDYSAGKDRIRFYDKGYIVLGASKKFSAPYRSKIKQLNSVSQSDFEESLNTETFNYNIGLGSWIQKLVDQVSDWNQEGEFNATSASRKDNSGNLGLGYRNGTPDDSLVGYWRMDRNVAGDGGTVKDYSGYGNDGTTQNNVNTGVQGVFGSSASEFRDDAITGPEDPSLQYNNHTLSFWIKQTSSLDSEYNLIIGLGDGSTNDDGTGGRLPYVYYHSDGSGSLHWRWSTATRGNDGLNTPADTITQNGWIHLTGVKKGKNYSIYKNGELLDSQELSSADAGTGYGGFKFRGDSRNNVTFKLDEIRLYNRKFTSKKIKDLYKYGKDGTFEGDYAVENQTGSFQRWEKLTVDAVIPSETSLEVVFESLDENGNVVDSQNIQLQTGEKSYNINSESSRGYRLTFQGNSSNPEKSWEVKDYNLKYGPELQRGSTIPLYTSAVVSDISSALIHRNGTFSEINNRVVVWP
jgi:hypothetical protein